MDDLFEVGPTVSFCRKVQANGASLIYPASQHGKPPWISHSDPDLLRWMGEHGYSCIEEIPADRDLRRDKCERCGALGIEVHHTAPREWFGDEACEEWPTQNLCRSCHAEWHRVADREAQYITLRILKQRGLRRMAEQLEAALAKHPERSA